jgi:hypothetical protein
MILRQRWNKHATMLGRRLKHATMLCWQYTQACADDVAAMFEACDEINAVATMQAYHAACDAMQRWQQRERVGAQQCNSSNRE